MATNILLGLTVMISATLICILAAVRKVSATGDISQALNQHPEMYTLSLGHMGDLTLQAFAYLKLPLVVAAAAFALCAVGLAVFRKSVQKTTIVLAAGMVIFFQASRLALVRFDSYLGSYELAQALQHHVTGQLIETNSYYAFSSVFFYADRTALLLNGRNNNLEYGSYAPGAPMVFIDDRQFSTLWNEPGLCYLLAYGSEIPHLRTVVGQEALHVVAVNSDNYLLSNQKLR